MKKVWILEKKNGDNWEIAYVHSNYYTFCGKVKVIFGDEDQKAIQELVSDLGEVPYDPYLKAKFKTVHDSVAANFRVFTGQAPDELTKWTGYNEGFNPIWKEIQLDEENEKVCRYLWQTKRKAGK